MGSTAELTEYRKGTKVVLTDDLPGVPQGTVGKLGRSVGFDVKRYRVRFANDVELLSVPHDRLVPAKQWPAYIAERTADEAAAAEREAAAELAAAAPPPGGQPAAAPAPDAPAPDAPAPGAPEAEAASEPEPASDASEAAEGRLAALLARSQKAREASGIAAPAPSAPEPAPTEEPHPMGVVEPAKADAPHAQESVDPKIEVPDGYFPRDNRVAELLDKFRN